jgi:hypothetical protein
MVRAVRAGEPMREVARRFRVSLSHVQRWTERVRGQRLDRADVSDRPGGCRQSRRRTSASRERRILKLRRELKHKSALGEYGAAAIHRALREGGMADPPSVRTIGRVLERRGALDGGRRTRRPAPPRGWYLPRLAAGRAELDSFDIVEGLAIKGGLRVEVLNAIGLHTGLVGSWPMRVVTSKSVVDMLLEHWRGHGIPDYAQFDNDAIFQGSPRGRDTVGRVIRLCLALGVTPVFAPPREMGFQAAIESYNGQWQDKVWSRFQHRTINGLRQRSDAYVAARHHRDAARIGDTTRRQMPAGWSFDVQRPLSGMIVYLRRTDARGRVQLLGHTHDVDSNWPHRLVRAEVEIDAGRVRFFALRRRDPDHQPLLKAIPYRLPSRRIREVTRGY